METGQYREVDTKLNVGDSIKICIANVTNEAWVSNEWITRGMRNYDGMETKVSRIIRCRKNNSVAYELEGVSSKAGLPYAWMREALIKLKRI